MFADLDDPDPPAATDGRRRAVADRSAGFVRADRRRQRTTRLALVAAIAAFVVVVAAVVVS
ncbi:MAG TPA: hypothetical protein VF320_01685, partial [Acidimicrobiales bacterium]